MVFPLPFKNEWKLFKNYLKGVKKYLGLAFTREHFLRFDGCQHQNAGTFVHKYF